MIDVLILPRIKWDKVVFLMIDMKQVENFKDIRIRKDINLLHKNASCVFLNTSRGGQREKVSSRGMDIINRYSENKRRL